MKIIHLSQNQRYDEQKLGSSQGQVRVKLAPSQGNQNTYKQNNNSGLQVKSKANPEKALLGRKNKPLIVPFQGSH